MAVEMLDRTPARGRRLAVRTPRQLLVISAVTMTVIGAQTFRYPPDYLAFSWLWGTIAIVSGISCAVCAWRPTRLLTTTSGATLSTISAGRALAIFGELTSSSFTSEELEASFVIAAALWTLVSVLFFVAWREYVVPWSISERRAHPRVHRPSHAEDRREERRP